MKRYYFLLSLMCFGLAGFVEAQSGLKPKFEAKSIYYQNQAYIRWAPASIESFNFYKDKRFRLTRELVKLNGAYVGDSAQLASLVVLGDSIRPLPEASWEPLANQSDLHAVAAGALYGTSFTLDSIHQDNYAAMYSLNSEKELRFNLSLFAADQSMDVAQKMGLAYVDQNLLPNAEYGYTLELVNSSYEIKKFIVLNTAEPAVFPAFDTLFSYTQGTQAALTWFMKSSQNLSQYSSFVVERSDNQGATFQVINPRPLMMTESTNGQPDYFYIDSLPGCTQDYVYRIAGKTYFGVQGPYSDTLHVRCKPLAIDDRPTIDSVVTHVNGTITVRWKFPSAQESKIKGFRIYRAETIDGVYEKLNQGNSVLTASTRQYLDAQAKPSNYYILEVEDNNGYRLSSIPRMGQQVDETPPVVPSGLNGVVLKNGDVEVRWTKNQENDLAGYRMFYTTHLQKEFFPVAETLLPDTAYYFPLDMTTELEYVYVKVHAQDKRENRSGYSQVLTLPVPDVWAPVAPVVKSSQKEKKKVVIRWIPSTSRDAKLHKIERRKYGTLAWTMVATYDSLRTTLGPFLQFSDANQQYSADSVSIVFIDSTLQEKQVYEYRVVAQDEVENRSYSEYVRAEALRSYVRHPQITVNVNPTAVKGGILVTWHIPDGCTGVLNFQVYRSKDGAPFVTYKTVQCDPLIPIRPGTNNGISGNDVIVLPPNTFGFLDYELEPLKGRPDPNNPPRRGKIYSYKVQVRYDDGDTSPVTPGKSAIGPPSIE